MSLKWDESVDTCDNTMWEAPGPYTDECGAPEFYFRIGQVLQNNKVTYVDWSDAELALRAGRVWDTLEEAKAELQDDCGAFLQEAVTLDKPGITLKKVDLSSMAPAPFQYMASGGDGPSGCNRAGDIFPSCLPGEKKRERLFALAEEYLGKTEEFDRSVCSGPMRGGEIMPADGREMFLINKNAREVRADLLARAQDEGFSAGDLDRAITLAGQGFNYDEYLKARQRSEA